MSEKVGVAVVGCGTISEIYLKNLTGLFKEVKVLGVWDLNPDAAKKRTLDYSLPRVYRDYAELLGDRDVEVVLNLTIPNAHFEVSQQAISAGKHVYSEKPLAVSLAEGRELIRLANAAEVRLGCSPDTFLGAGSQTCRKLIDDGYIGKVVGVSANLIKRGVETWHPNPGFLYQPGAGPVLDMGPYYLSALVNMLGCISEAVGMSAISFPTRFITSQPKYGQIIEVKTPTHVNSLLRFENGALGTFTATFDVHKANLPFIEVYGENGTLSVPYPNDFGGPIRLFRPETGNFTDFPPIFPYQENSRGLGLTDLCKAIRTNRPHRASAELALHVLECLEIILNGGQGGTVSSRCPRPAPMARGGVSGILD